MQNTIMTQPITNAIHKQNMKIIKKKKKHLDENITAAKLTNYNL